MSDNKSRAILGSAATLFALSLLNKGFGFVKSVTIASVFGATIETDAYYVAEGLMQNALIPIADAFAVSFLPIYIGIRKNNSKDSYRFTSRAITDVFLLALLLSGVLYIVSPVILRIILPTYEENQICLSVEYFRILIWGMCFYMSNQLLQSLLNAEKEYGYSSFTAMLNNLILTVAVLLLGYRFGLHAMAVAVPFSYLAQYVFLQIKSRNYGRMTLQYGMNDSRIWLLFRRAFPVFFGNAVYELNQLVDRSLLSGMEEGSVTAVSYAAVLYQFASNLITIPMTTIIYTELAESFASARMDEGAAKLEKGIHISLVLCVPLTLFVMVTSKVIVQITYGRGAFDEQAVVMTAQGLACYSLCYLAYCINLLLNRASYSLGDTILPMKMGLGTVGINIVLSITLSRVIGLKGIVLATAIATSIICVCTLWIFNRKKMSIHLRQFSRSGIIITVAAAVATWICFLWLRWANGMNIFLVFVAAAILEFGIYAVLLTIAKDAVCLEMTALLNDCFKNIMNKIRKKFNV